MFETGMSALVLKICSEYAKSLGLNFPPCTQQEINAICQWVDKQINGMLDKPATPAAESAVVLGTDGTVSTKTFNEIVLPVTDKTYELIEEINLTEDTATIDRTFNNFFTKLLVKLEFPEQTSSIQAYINVDVKGTILNARKVGVIESFFGTTKKYALLDVSVSNNVLKNNSSFGILNVSSPYDLKCVSTSYGEIGFGKIKGIIFNARNANIPTGTVIKLYGVRA